MTTLAKDALWEVAMETLTIELSTEVHKLLLRRAAEAGLEIEAMAAEAIRRWLLLPNEAQRMRIKRERVRQKLRDAGLIRPISEELRKMIIPNVRHEDVEAAFARAGGKPLSQIIIEQRGPKL
jgi:hypothetical protein